MASSYGRVMRAPFQSKHPRAGGKHYGGVPTYGTWDGVRYIWRAHGKNFKVARLVCEAFNGQPPFEGAVCMHLNEMAFCNFPANLAWGTQKQNLNAPGFLAYCARRVGDDSPTRKGNRRAAA